MKGCQVWVMTHGLQQPSLSYTTVAVLRMGVFQRSPQACRNLNRVDCPCYYFLALMFALMFVQPLNNEFYCFFIFALYGFLRQIDLHLHL